METDEQRNQRNTVAGPTPTISHALQDLMRDIGILVKSEGQLLRKELEEKTVLVKAGSLELVGGLILALLGIQALAAAIIVGLAQVMAWWLAATVVGVIFIGTGALLAWLAKKTMNLSNLKPTQSAEALHMLGAKIKEKAHDLYH